MSGTADVIESLNQRIGMALKGDGKSAQVEAEAIRAGE
jgi:hypothetical protein